MSIFECERTTLNHGERFERLVHRFRVLALITRISGNTWKSDSLAFEQWKHRDSFQTLIAADRWLSSFPAAPPLYTNPSPFVDFAFIESKSHQRLSSHPSTDKRVPGCITYALLTTFNTIPPPNPTSNPHRHEASSQPPNPDLLNTICKPMKPLPPLQLPPDNNLNAAHVVIPFVVKDRIRCW